MFQKLGHFGAAWPPPPPPSGPHTDWRFWIRAPDSSLRRHGWELAGASFVVLFQELALIRWLPVEVRVVGYFPNLILLSAFLGLAWGRFGLGRNR